MVAKHFNFPLHWRIALSFAALAICLGAGLSSYYQARTAKLLLTATDDVFDRVATELTLNFQRSYRPVREMTSQLSRSQVAEPRSFESRLSALPMIAAGLEALPEVAGLQVGYDNGDYFIVRSHSPTGLQQGFGAPPETHWIVDHIDRGNRTGAAAETRHFFDERFTRIKETSLGQTLYDPRTRPWYIEAKTSAETVVTKPYVFFFLRTVGITVARQSTDGQAVVAADIPLEALSRTLTQVVITPNAETLLFLPDGTAMASSHPEQLLVGEGEDNIRLARIEELHTRALLTDAANDSDSDGWIRRTRVLNLAPGLAPTLAIAVPREELLGDAYDIWWQALLVAGLLILLSLPASWWAARSVTRPLRQLRAAVSELGSGNLDVSLPLLERRDEVGALNNTFRQMQQSLKLHIADLQKATAARQHLESELGIARDIQMSMVPGGGELLLHQPPWQVAARLLPAKAVGGDLFELIDDGERMLVVVGDVCDKGVPAALFMARVVTLIKYLHQQHCSLERMVLELNAQLCQDNDNCMFVTLICGILDRHTGAFNFVSAGHNPPALTTSGISHWVECCNGPPLGLQEFAAFPMNHLIMPAQSTLVLYTDGITEAFNTERQEFGNDRLLACLQQVDDSASSTLTTVLDAVTHFAEGAEQSDDITLMLLRRD